MATQIVCPRCKGSLQPEARSCPRCGLVISPRVSLQPDAPPPAPVDSGRQTAPSPAPSNGRQYASSADAWAFPPSGTGAPPEDVQPFSPEERAPAPRPQERSRTSGPLSSSAVSYRPGGTGPLVPRGALELLPGESVAFQLGALYLTTKRVILLAPSVVRSAFVRDIDAVGTFTERSSAWVPIFGFIMLALSGFGFYAWTVQPQWRSTFPLLADMGIVLPIVAALFALWGLYLLARYFFWTKRTLFVSVKGRPLITVSIADWSQRKLEGMDSFVNAFFGIKDLMTGELGEVE